MGSQNSESKLRLSQRFAIFACALVVASCGNGSNRGNDPISSENFSNVYSSEYQESFMEGCNSDGTSKNLCQCILEEFKLHYTEDELKLLAKYGVPKSVVRVATNACGDIPNNLPSSVDEFQSTAQKLSKGRSCREQWSHAHSESLGGSGQDYQIRGTLYTCSNAAEWTKYATFYGEYFDHLLEAICALEENAPRLICE